MAHRARSWRSVARIVLISLVVSVQACGGSSGLAEKPCAAGEIGVLPNCFPAPPAPASPDKTWSIAFSEDFNSNDFDPSKLSACFDWNQGSCTDSFNQGRESYRPEQVRVRDGIAKLIAEPLLPPEPNDACYQGICTYKSGLLSTARPTVEDQYLFPFTYGYVESRLKFPSIPGMFTAFWMVPTDPTFKYRTEIDIAEILGGHPQDVFMTYAYDDRNRLYKINKGPQDNGACPVRDYSRDWVRLGVDWQRDHIAWYIDGVKCGEFTDAAAIENGPMQIILDLMVDTNWERDVNSLLPNQSIVGRLDVDYIRIYQQR